MIERTLHLLVTEIHRDFSEAVVKIAKEYAPSVSCRIENVWWVPGSLEFPLAVTEILARREVNAFVIIGVLERGQTRHGDIIAHQVTKCLLDIQIQHRVPMAVSIIGPGATMEHAENKCRRTTEKAIRTALHMLEFKANI